MKLLSVTFRELTQLLSGDQKAQVAAQWRYQELVDTVGALVCITFPGAVFIEM
jgi:hypothetical protein